MEFNLFEDHDFDRVFPTPTTGKDRVQRDLFKKLMQNDFATRKGTRDAELTTHLIEEMDALVVALEALNAHN